MRPRPEAAVFALLIALSPPTQAWTLEGWGYPEAAHPVTLYLHPDPEDSLPEGAAPGLLDDAAASWTALGCNPASIQLGEGEGSAGARRDDLNSVSFDDPYDELGAGAIAVTTTTYSTTTSWRSLGGAPIYVVLESDMVFNDFVEFATPEEIAAGDCPAGGRSLQATATHELGHVLGLGHSCERNGDCLDPGLEAATMNWTVGDCDDSRSALSEDDEAGLFALYGPEGDFGAAEAGACEGVDGALSGALPFEVRCEAGGAPEVSWDMGDSTQLSGAALTHTYTEPGVYTPAWCVSTSCGPDTWCGEAEPLAACDAPDPSFSALEVEGPALRLINNTEAPYGCLDEVRWTIEDDSGALIAEDSGWSFIAAVPEEGRYTATLWLSGVAGEASVSQEVWAGPRPEEEPKGRCASGPPAGALASLLGLMLLGLGRRR